MIGVALVGLGEIGQWHLRALATSADADLRAVCDLDSDLLAQAADRAARTTQDLGDILRDESVELVSICLPHHLHAPIAERCLDAGKHVLLEKPMTMTVAEADRVIDRAAAAGRTIGVSHNQVFFEPHRRIRAWIDDGRLGRVHQIRARLAIGGKYGAWRADPTLAGGGLLIDAGVHRVYTVRYLAGEIVAATAVMDQPGREDAFVVTFEHEAGTVSVVDGSYHGPAGAFDDRIEVAAEGGLVEAVGCEAFFERFASGPQLRIYRDGGWQNEDVVDSWDASVIASVQAFVRAVAAGEAPPVSGADGRAVVAAVEAAYESARSGRRVEVRHV